MGKINVEGLGVVEIEGDVPTLLFPGEGHGFRDRAVQQRVLEATEAFFRRHLDLP